MLKYWAKKVAQKLEFAPKSDNERPIKKKKKKPRSNKRKSAIQRGKEST